MLVAISEDLLLKLALDRGLISLQDISRATVKTGAGRPNSRFGPRIETLIQDGRLTAETVQRLCAEAAAEIGNPLVSDQTLSGTAQPPAPPLALDATLSASSAPSPGGRSPTPAAGTGSSPVEPIGTAQTLDSNEAGLPASAPSRQSMFPVPNWEKYEFLGLLGRGGMGAVFKGRDRRLGRVVALKFIHGDSPGQIQRFMQEARAQARLDHPNICKVYEVGTVDDKPYIAMQLVNGLPLHRASRTMKLLEKVRVMKVVAEAMHSAHEQGIIHRDLKPSNILVSSGASADGTASYEPVVMDFGLARDSSDGNGLTESGDILGTPAYMSPEQARGEARRLDRRSDVYSLGATLYDILVGKPPFEDETAVNIILKVMNDTPRPLRSHDPTLPEALELIVSKCLNKEADQRYSTAKALAEDLDRFLSAGRVEARRLSYRYRLQFFARRNKALTLLGAALLLSLLGLTGFGVYTRIVNLRKEQLARQEAELAQKLGQSVKDLEWLVRTAYLLPLHDTWREKRLIRERMAEITQELRKGDGTHADRLGAYVLGRGHLALHEWDMALDQLKRAEQLGYRDPELDYALGRALGERYNRAIEEARRSGDKSFFEKRRKELEQALLIPARTYLRNSRQLKTVSTSYIEALIDFYNQHYDAALLNAQMAQQQQPWLYEAAKLQGDVHMARALDARDHGDHTQAERHFADAVARYEEASTIGHSDHLVHEAIAEAWIRQEEMDMYRGINPEPKFQAALAAADRALEAAPNESKGYTKKAFAYFFQAQYVQNHITTQDVLTLYEQQAILGRKSIVINSNDAYAYDIIGIANLRIAQLLSSAEKPTRAFIEESYKNFESALRINPYFPWAHNDYGVALIIEAIDKMKHNKDPQPVLRMAIERTKQAISNDGQYLVAFANLSGEYAYIGKWLMEHGLDPTGLIHDAINASESALRISDKHLFSYGNLGEAYHLLSQYQYDAGLDVLPAAEMAIKSFGAMVSIDKNIPPAYGNLAVVHHVIAKNKLARNKDPSETIMQGLNAIKECYRVQLDFAECQAGEALLWAVRAEWDQRQGRPFLGALTQARQLAQKATRQAPTNEDLLLA